jgi:hypothetical protein
MMVNNYFVYDNLDYFSMGQLQYVTCTAGGSIGGNTVVWNLGTIPNGTIGSVSVVARVIGTNTTLMHVYNYAGDNTGNLVSNLIWQFTPTATLTTQIYTATSTPTIYNSTVPSKTFTPTITATPSFTPTTFISPIPSMTFTPTAAGTSAACGGVEGQDWTAATTNAAFPARYLHGCVSYDNGTGIKLWVFGGANAVYPHFSDVWSSSDGADWSEATSTAAFGQRGSFSTFVHNGKVWLTAGDINGTNMNDVWSSTNMITWTQVTATAAFSVRDDATSIVFNDGSGEKMWIIAGEPMTGSDAGLNDVWNSADGITWNQSTASAAFPERFGAAGTVYNGKMWISGGIDSTLTCSNDVWYSSDGINWAEATAHAAFGPRHLHSMIVYDNKMWVLGGSTYSDGIVYNDVWWSTDGVNWTSASLNTPMGEDASAAVIYNSQLWITGGSIQNDAWYTCGNPPQPVTPSETATVTMTYATPGTGATNTPTANLTPQPTCNMSVTPVFTVQVTYNNGHASANSVVIDVTSNSDFTVPPSLVVHPYGESASKPAVNLDTVKFSGASVYYRAIYPEAPGYGDIDSIVVTGTDVCGRTGVSNGKYTKTSITGGHDTCVYHNVFNPDKHERVRIVYNIYGPDVAHIKVYSKSGTLVRSICSCVEDGSLKQDETSWYGTNSNDRTVVSGIYYITIQTSYYMDMIKVAVIR